MLMDPLIGHRGVAGLAPENTLAGIRKAAELGFQWVELDVTLLGDGQPVIFHDRRVNRTSNSVGLIKSYGLNEARALDVGSWFSTEFAQERIPTLREALLLIKELQLGLNLELKVNSNSPRQLARVVSEVLNEVALPEDKLVVSSFNIKALRYFHSLHSAHIGCLFHRLPKHWQSIASGLQATSIHLGLGNLCERQVKSVKRHGYEVYCYTVNQLYDLKLVQSWGADGLFSDAIYPVE